MAGRLEGPRTSWRGAGVLCGMVGLAAGSIHVAWGSMITPLPLAHPGPVGQQAAATILPALLADSEHSFSPEALTTRPLFSPNRRPRVEVEPVPEPAAPEPLAPAPAAPPPSYLIDGVMVFADIRKILLRRQPREAGQWLSQGETTLEGWTIVSVRADSVVMQQGEQEVVMALRARSPTPQ